MNSGYSSNLWQKRRLLKKRLMRSPILKNLNLQKKNSRSFCRGQKEQGSVHSESDSTQTKVSEDRAKEKNGIITSEKIKSEKLNNEKLNKEPNETDHTRSRRKFAGMGEKVIKWAAVAAVTVFGIFGVSMTSEANRAYVMETVNDVMGNSTETEIDNEDTKDSSLTEEEARENIIAALNIEMPRFFYWPTDAEYQDYSIDEAAHTAIMLYTNNDANIHFVVISNEKDASFLASRDLGKQIKELNSEYMQNIKVGLWEVLDEGDEQPTYILQWEYKNVYYELSGKISESEMENIAKNILY